MREPNLRIAERQSLDGEVLVCGRFDGEQIETAGFAPEVRGVLDRLAARPGFRGREEQRAEAEVELAGRPAVVSVCGLGPRDEFSPRDLAAWFLRIVEIARGLGARRVAVALPGHPALAGEAGAERALAGLLLAGYRYERFLAEESQKAPLQEIEVAAPPGEDPAYRAALETALAVAAAGAYARDLANTPPNEAGPQWLEERARELGESHGLEIEVLDAAELTRRGMGGLLAVGAGSAQPPRLIRLAAGTEGPLVAFVGKGITFDSGGISIKPAKDMDEMKYDKGGACAVLGLLRAAIDLALPVRIRGYLAVAENLLDGRSYRPGDILRCANGKTVEITNTDAEGRLVLADALTWAAAEGPDTLIELSTLTGACGVALGTHLAGLFTPDDRLAEELLAAGTESGERLWRLPIGPEYLEEMRGQHADLRNSAGRLGSACTAAAFLSQFVGDVARWAHLDIASVVHRSAEELGQKGATGFGVALCVRWLQRAAPAS